jgi:hypothetical protein
MSAFHQVRETQKRCDGKADLRTAAFITAIDQIALYSEDLGFYPQGTRTTEEPS